MLFLSIQNVGRKAMVLSHFISVLFPLSFAVDPDCNYYQIMDIDVTYYIYNKEYPNKYGPNQECRWIAEAPNGYTIEAKCTLEIPESPGCNADHLMISTDGNSNLENAHTYCGYGNTSIESDFNRISLGLVSTYNTYGGRFLCTIQTKNAPPSCDCGWKSNRRIVGGEETGINEYPMMAGIVDYQLRDIICGATIIANRYAVSAAHCFTGKSPSYIGLLIGEHDITIGTETNATRLLTISQFIIHPNYNENDPSAVNDIALVRTSENIEFNMQVGPACLPFNYLSQSFEYQTVEVLGWGTTDFTGPKSNVLLKAYLNVLTYRECFDKVQGTVDQMCTYNYGHDACQSDSGGPLLWMDPSTYRMQLLGVVSLGYGCATTRPAINTRVTSYLQWIVSATPDVQYCVK